MGRRSDSNFKFNILRKIDNFQKCEICVESSCLTEILLAKHQTKKHYKNQVVCTALRRSDSHGTFRVFLVKYILSHNRLCNSKNMLKILKISNQTQTS